MGDVLGFPFFLHQYRKIALLRRSPIHEFCEKAIRRGVIILVIAVWYVKFQKWGLPHTHAHISPALFFLATIGFEVTIS